ncbi:MAG: peptide-methionine (R)-S-oxide reductase [Verrucomicrobiota bacterium]|jgi:methionine-R-sulfoxide reductase
MSGGRITSDEKSTVSMYIGLILLTGLAAGGIYFFLLTQETKDPVGFDPNTPVQSDAILKRRLKPEQYKVVRENGTQMPFQNEFWNNDKPGIYVDVITNEPLFTSVDKYDANLGMPTWSKPISYDLLVEVPDNSHDMQRVEVRAKRSNAHLGHVFGEPQSPTGRRYTLNSAAFHFVPAERMKLEHYEAYLPLLEKKPGAP